MSSQLPPSPNTAAPKTTNYYQLLQVDPTANTTVIRYAYRYMAAMYHPDNAETADVEKFKNITEAWRVLSDPNRRNAYDLQLGAGVAVKPQVDLQTAIGRAGSMATDSPRSTTASAGADSQDKTPVTQAVPSPPEPEPKASTAWSEVELRLSVLQVLLDAKRKKPQGGGASATLLMDCLGVELSELEYTLWYLREKNYIKREDVQFSITIAGVDYLIDQLSKAEILNPK
jgi:curved DNA-binding protein